MKEVFDEVQLHVIARVGELPVPVLRHNLLASSVLSDNQLALRAGSAFFEQLRHHWRLDQ